MQPEKFRSLAAMVVIAAFFVTSGAATLSAAWIPLKAELAQLLLERSWNKVKNGASHAPPWPWADTQAVALLEIDRLDIGQIILEGSSGRNLAFGPTLAEGSKQGKDWVISGHRDTHFRFLQHLQTGDVLRIETRADEQLFVVDSLEIVDSRDFELVMEPGQSRLSLVTCYPFDAISTGGPLRYVVTALPLASSG